MKLSKKLLRTVFGLMLSLLFLSSCGHEHTWTPATCTTPEACAECDSTQGDPLGHSWEEATCRAPKTCTVCNLTEGVSLAHTWVDATCSVPKTCSVCRLTEGEALGHLEGNWQTYSVDYVDATVSSRKSCSVCSDVLDTQTVSIKQLHDSEHFLFSPGEFVSRFNDKLDSIGGNTYTAASGSVDKDFACGILSLDGDKAGVLMFADYDTTITTSDKDTHGCFATILGSVHDTDSFARVMIALVLTCDPTLSFDEAKEVALKTTEEEDVTRNGITYMVIFSSGDAIIGVAIDK